MDETQRRGGPPEPPEAEIARSTPPSRRGGGNVLWWLLALLLAFLAGFGWQYFRAASIEDELARTEQELAVERLRVGLAQAAVAAQSGDFEAARRQMSDFFTAMQERLEAGDLPEEVRTVGEELLRDRDAVITDLSRANPAAADVLYGMLQRFRLSLGDAPVPAVPGAGDSFPADGG